MAFVSGQLRLFGSHFQIMINQLLADTQLLYPTELALTIQSVNLNIKRCLDLIFRLFGLGALLDPPRRRLDCPQRVRISHILRLFRNCISLVPLLNLYLPYLIALFLHRFSSPMLPAFLLFMLDYLIMELLLLANQCVYLFRETFFD